jgi:hypothetical protein
MYWLITSIMPSSKVDKIKQMTPQKISYVANGLAQERGKILAVVTSADVMGVRGKVPGMN